jgi:Tol biopolymer transport system component
VWSPDGKYIAFMRFADDRQLNGIYIASSLGGSERRIYGVDANKSTREIDWSPDGKYLVFAERNSATEPASIYQISLDTLEKKSITFPPPGILGDSSPAFSPDGKSLAFQRDFLDTQEIFIVPAGGGTPRQVTFDKRIIQGVSWNASGNALIYSSNRAGPPSLWLIPATGGKPERLPFGGGTRAVRPTVARRGNRMAYTLFTYTSDIWRAELPLPEAFLKAAHTRVSNYSKVRAANVAGVDGLNRASTEKGNTAGISPAAKFITSTELEEGPQYSPDGKRIIFQSTRTGNYEIWRCDVDGANLLQLTHMEGPLTGTPRWSPDGREIVFDSRPDGHSHLFVISAEGGRLRQVTSGDTENGVADWSVDGKSIYFGSSRGGTWEIWKMPAQGGTPVQITHQGGFAPQSAPDGKFIYYAKGRELPGLWRVPVDGGEEVKIMDAPPPTAWGYFTPTKDGIYYGDAPSRSEKDLGIYFYDFQTRKSSVVRLLEHFGSEGAPGLSISPDGRYALYTTLSQPAVNVMLVENFRY